MAMAEAHMEGRVAKLEQQVDGLSIAVNTMSGRIDKMSDALTKLTSMIEGNKPVSYTGMLTTVIATATFVSMVVGAIFFLVDARVGSATTRANTFVSAMEDNGKLYVSMEKLNMRLDRLETAIKWKPSFE